MKKQKKAFDVATFIKREVSKSRRELFLILHKTHYVCLLAHLTHIDCLLSNPLLKAMGLSLVPLTYGSTPVTKLTLVGLGALVSWLRGAIPVGLWMDLPIKQVFPVSVLGNMVPILPLLLPR